MKLSIKELQEMAMKKVVDIEEKTFSWADEQICQEAKKGNFWIELTFPRQVRDKAIDEYLEGLKDRGLKAEYKDRIRGKVKIEWYINE